VPHDYFDVLYDASALASNDVWAVGQRFVTNSVADPTLALIAHWDGSAWAIVPGADQHGRGASLAAVDAVSRDDVWAVGKYESTSSPQSREDPLIQHWDGHAWRVVPVPAIGQDQSPEVPRGLVSLSAASPTDIWALGYYGDNTSGATVSRDAFIHWDGRSWKLVSSPRYPQTTGISSMEDVSAVSANAAWAVGGTLIGFGEHSGAGSSLLERWDGRAWSRVPSPKVSLPLTRVFALGANDVWAVRGGTVVSAEGSQPFGPAGVVHWDGHTWTLGLSLPNTDGTFINDIVAKAANDVWIVGIDGRKPLIRHWNGRRWVTPKGAAPPSDARSVSLGSISRTAQGDVVAFGSDQDRSRTAQTRLWFGCGRPSP